MTKCYSAPFIMKGASMGRETPLPDIKNVSYIHAAIATTENVPEHAKTYINKGMISTMLPYTQQDGYDRNRTEKSYTSVVIENEHLKAIFLPELGGRLWSLFDKDAQKELLYRNPVFQPGNLALRNAWFSGGVEFNVSIKGHNPLTCDPLFARKITLADGGEGLRMFEYERIRGVMYSIDAWIPKDGHMLYIRPKIENRTGHEIWTYWWSNIATPVVDKCRVIVPAEDTFINYFGNDSYVLDFSKLENALGTDVSYPANLKRSLDFFYYIKDSDPKWITAVDENGYGLIQCSSDELKGRKLFLWGEGAGGKNWNRYLSDGSNKGYIEIQAGLARTQLEHIPMPQGATFTWVEAYGAADCGTAAHGAFKEAQSAVDTVLNKRFPHGMSETLAKAKETEVFEQDYILFGSGWGVLEEHRRKVAGEPSLSQSITMPEGALKDAQKEWLVLLYNGFLPERDPSEEPVGYVVDAFWRDLLAKSLQNPKNRNWYALMQLGVMEYAAGNVNTALDLFKESVEVKENAWSLRNAAMIYRNELGDIQKAYEYMQKAFDLCKTCRGILNDTAVTYLAAEKYEEWLTAFEQIGKFKNDGRLQLHKVSALMALSRYEEAAEILNPEFLMPDIKEADSSLSDIWFKLYGEFVHRDTGITDEKELHALTEKLYPLGELDFRTH